MQASRDQPETLNYRSHPHLYEINTRAWLQQLSAKHGGRMTLGDAPDEEWDSLRTLGFDFVWLMGIWKRSAAGRRIFRTDPMAFPMYDEALPGWKMRDVVGSPYSIQEYEPDPRLATWDQIDFARQKLHSRGLGLILDFVPNHTALDHPWIESHPEYYVLGTQEDFRKSPSAFYLIERPGERAGPERDDQTIFVARAKDPYFPPWSDVAQLNYFLPATREAMIGELRKIAQHCDGVRCDMAMLLLNEVFAKTWGPLISRFHPPEREFWSDAIAAVPGLIWIAEVYWNLEWRLQQLGFAFTYDKRLYDCLRQGSARKVNLHLKADPAYQRKLVRFLENHDESRSLAVFGTEKLPAVGTIVATLPGMRFYHQGQLEGKRLRLPVQLGRAANEAPDPAVHAFYEKILRIANEEAFHKGEWRLLELRSAGDATFESLVAYQWRFENAWKVIVVNLSNATAQGLLSLGDQIDASKQYVLFDQLNDTTYERSGSDLAQNGLYVRLEEYGSHILAVSARRLADTMAL